MLFAGPSLSARSREEHGHDLLLLLLAMKQAKRKKHTTTQLGRLDFNCSWKNP